MIWPEYDSVHSKLRQVQTPKSIFCGLEKARSFASRTTTVLLCIVHFFRLASLSCCISYPASLLMRTFMCRPPLNPATHMFYHFPGLNLCQILVARRIPLSPSSFGGAATVLCCMLNMGLGNKHISLLYLLSVIARPGLHAWWAVMSEAAQRQNC